MNGYHGEHLMISELAEDMLQVNNKDTKQQHQIISSKLNVQSCKLKKH